MGGWDMMRERLEGEEGRVMIHCFDTCTDSIRTIPALQHDESRPEDVNTNGEDHAGDEWRYACMARPWVRPKPKAVEDIAGMEALTMDRLWRHRSSRVERRL